MRWKERWVCHKIVGCCVLLSLMLRYFFLRIFSRRNEFFFVIENWVDNYYVARKLELWKTFSYDELIFFFQHRNSEEKLSEKVAANLQSRRIFFPSPHPLKLIKLCNAQELFFLLFNQIIFFFISLRNFSIRTHELKIHSLLFSVTRFCLEKTSTKKTQLICQIVSKENTRKN